MPSPKRQQKSKDEVASALAHKAKIARQRTLARLVYPFLEGLDTVYDAQTVVNAASGFIRYDLAQRETAVKVGDIKLDLSQEKDERLKAALEHVISQLATEPATEAATLLELMGTKMPSHLANEALKQPMSTLKMDDFIA